MTIEEILSFTRRHESLPLSLNVLIMTSSCYIDCTGPVPRLPSSVQCLTSNVKYNCDYNGRQDQGDH